jgi:hypothetical protein
MYSVLISSVTYFLAFVWPEYCGWMGIASLWILTMSAPRSLGGAFASGALWGVIFFSAQFLWMFLLLLWHSPASLVIKLSVWSLFIVYLSLFSALWFVLRFVLEKYIHKTVSFVISTTLFFITVYWGSGLPWEIVQNPLCDFALPVIIFFKAWIVYQYIPEGCIFLGVSALPFFVGIKSYNKKIMSIMMLLFYMLSLQKQASFEFEDRLYHWKSGTLSQAVVQARELGKNIIVGCEGMLQRVSELEVLPADIVLISGAYYFYDDGSYDNCAVCVVDGKVQTYRKQFLVPYIENKKSLGCFGLFAQTCRPGKKNTCTHFMIDAVMIQPVICSDLYFGTVQLVCDEQKPPILFFTSHELFYFHFTKNVLRNFIKKKKHILQLNILYVSNEESFVI